METDDPASAPRPPPSPKPGSHRSSSVPDGALKPRGATVRFKPPTQNEPTLIRAPSKRVQPDQASHSIISKSSNSRATSKISAFTHSNTKSASSSFKKPPLSLFQRCLRNTHRMLFATSKEIPKFSSTPWTAPPEDRLKGKVHDSEMGNMDPDELSGLKTPWLKFESWWTEETYVRELILRYRILALRWMAYFVLLYIGMILASFRKYDWATAKYGYPLLLSTMAINLFSAFLTTYRRGLPFIMLYTLSPLGRFITQFLELTCQMSISFFDIYLVEHASDPLGSVMSIVVLFICLTSGLCATFRERMLHLAMTLVLIFGKVALILLHNPNGPIAMIIYLLPIIMNLVLVLDLVYYGDKEKRINFLKTKLVEHQLGGLQEEKQKTEYLLSLTLPASIVTKLTEVGTGNFDLISDRLDSATIMFMDVKNYKEIATNLGSERDAVVLLNMIFHKIDEFIEMFPGIDRIKTINSKVLLLGGLNRGNHLMEMINMALALRDLFSGEISFDIPTETSTRHVAVSLHLGFGIQCGPLITGIVGKRTFCFEVYGDTVNTASRMLSIAKYGEIVVTSQVWEQMKDEYQMSSLGEKEVKGKGSVSIYRVDCEIGGVNPYPLNAPIKLAVYDSQSPVDASPITFKAPNHRLPPIGESRYSQGTHSLSSRPLSQMSPPTSSQHSLNPRNITLMPVPKLDAAIIQSTMMSSMRQPTNLYSMQSVKGKKLLPKGSFSNSANNSSKSLTINQQSMSTSQASCLVLDHQAQSRQGLISQDLESQSNRRTSQSTNVFSLALYDRQSPRRDSNQPMSGIEAAKRTIYQNRKDSQTSPEIQSLQQQQNLSGSLHLPSSADISNSSSLQSSTELTSSTTRSSTWKDGSRRVTKSSISTLPNQLKSLLDRQSQTELDDSTSSRRRRSSFFQKSRHRSADSKWWASRKQSKASSQSRNKPIVPSVMVEERDGNNHVTSSQALVLYEEGETSFDKTALSMIPSEYGLKTDDGLAVRESSISKAASGYSLDVNMIFSQEEINARITSVTEEMREHTALAQSRFEILDSTDDINANEQFKKEIQKPDEPADESNLTQYLLETLANDNKERRQYNLLMDSQDSIQTSKSKQEGKWKLRWRHADLIQKFMKATTMEFRSSALEKKYRLDRKEKTWQQLVLASVKAIFCQIIIVGLALTGVVLNRGYLGANFSVANGSASGLDDPNSWNAIIGVIFAATGSQLLVTGVSIGGRSPRMWLQYLIGGWSIMTLILIVILASLPWDYLTTYYLLISFVLPQIVCVYILSLDHISFKWRLVSSAAFALGIGLMNMTVQFNYWLVPFAPLVTTLLWGVIFNMREASARSEYLLDLMLTIQANMARDEIQKSNRVLQSILPSRIIMRLLSDPTLVFYEEFKMITVLHMDIAGFTAMSSKLEPLDIFLMLNTLFTYFDCLTEDFHVEKITTIGDAYVASSSLAGNTDAKISAISVCIVALQMQSYVQNQLNPSYLMSSKLRQQLQMRIGVHSGPCHGAIMGGSTNFRYDLMGDTVVIAEKIQEQCKPGCVYISSETMNKVKNYHGFDIAGTEKRVQGMDVFHLIGNQGLQNMRQEDN